MKPYASPPVVPPLEDSVAEGLLTELDVPDGGLLVVELFPDLPELLQADKTIAAATAMPTAPRAASDFTDFPLLMTDGATAVHSFHERPALPGRRREAGMAS
jgi:hypothetical protein